jgi:hypothetical protein
VVLTLEFPLDQDQKYVLIAAEIIYQAYGIMVLKHYDV